MRGLTTVLSCKPANSSDMNYTPADTAQPLVAVELKLSSKFTNVVKAVVLLW
jgi:hypothetical protein